MSETPPPSQPPVNPYAPTSSTGDDPQARITQAGRGTRLAAAMIDGVLLMIFIIPLQMLSGFTERAMQNDVGLIEQVVMSASGMVIFLALFGYTLVTRGQTIGKLLLGIRIVDVETGELLPFMRIYVMRYLWTLPFIIVTILIPGSVDDLLVNLLILVDCLMIFRRDHRCLHDLIAGSKVVTVIRNS